MNASNCSLLSNSRSRFRLVELRERLHILQRLLIYAVPELRHMSNINQKTYEVSGAAFSDGRCSNR